MWGRAVPALTSRIENHGSLNGAQIVINGVDGWQCQIDVYRGKILNRHISSASYQRESDCLEWAYRTVKQL